MVFKNKGFLTCFQLSVFIFLVLTPSSGHCENVKSRLVKGKSPSSRILKKEWGTNKAVGVHYPGFSARYAFRHWILEAAYSQEADIKAYGPRVIYAANPGSRAVYYGGVEYDWIRGESDIQEFTGRALTAFGGVELFATRKMSVSLEMGPTHMQLDSEDVGLGAKETGLVMNLGLHWYF
jgi:hypothetical protein